MTSGSSTIKLGFVDKNENNLNYGLNDNEEDQDNSKISIKHFINNDEKKQESEETQNTREYSNSNPRMTEIRKFEERQKLGVLSQLFGKFEKGSLRMAVINWMRFTIGCGVFCLPQLFQRTGIPMALVLLTFAIVASYMSFRFIFQASVAANLKDYKQLVLHYLPKVHGSIFSVTLSIDYLSSFVIYSCVSWQLFTTIYDIFIPFSDDKFDKKKPIKDRVLDQYHPTIFLMRAGYFVVIFLLMIGLLLKKSLESLKFLSIMYLGVLLSIIAFIFCQLPSYYSHFQKEKKEEIVNVEEESDLKMILTFFTFLLTFYVQPFVLSIRNDVLLPTFDRLNKVTYYSCIFEYIIYAVFGVSCAIVIGTNIKEIILFRDPIDRDNIGIIDRCYQVLQVLFCVLITLGMASFNPTFRSYLETMITFKNKALGYKVLSLVPIIIGMGIAVVYPMVLDIFGILGVTISNYNGFILPVAMKIKLAQIERASAFKIFLLRLLLAFYVIIGLIIGSYVAVESVSSNITNAY